MNIIFEQAQYNDIDELEILYNLVNDHLALHINFPGWRKGIYPDRQTAVEGIDEKCLYTARYNGRIIASVILRHKPEAAYEEVKWNIEADYEDIVVVYTFAVHPDYMGKGVGRLLMDFVISRSISENAKAIRLDVYEKNTPAIRLYEKCGFQYTGTVDLGLEAYGLKWFRLYERLL